MEDDKVSYLITDPKYYSHNSAKFKEKLTTTLSKHSVKMACFRDKHSNNFEELAKVFVDTCKEFNIEKILINSDYLLAKKLGANGVHLNSKQFDKIKESKDLGLYVVISCHNYIDLENAQKNFVNAVTYSPIFETPNKKEPKGIGKLREALRDFEDLDIIALGGIIDNFQIEQIKKTTAYGFASIRYFAK